jgi:GNAT superfamily N-acetyltransferase
MENTILRPALPERDFRLLAAWFTDLEDEPNSEPRLREYYEKKKELIHLMIAEKDQGEPLGFYWTQQDELGAKRAFIYLYVRPDQRRQGIGKRLYEDLRRAAEEAQLEKLHVRVWDNCPDCWTFAEKRGFTERSHGMMMSLDLNTFDDRPYDEILTRLKGEGFHFTSMAELGNTEEAQHKLYVLNETTGMDVPGTSGEPSWGSFEEFQQSVCQSYWYKPDGQMVVIDTNNGIWAAMSAISVFEGANYAYNLHTGVDRRYRGRKLGQAVKIMALRYAREVLNTDTVRTQHNVKNLPMIAIDRKFGYQQMAGIFLMEKVLEAN